MLEFRTGNIFDEDAEALVNAVNCVGIMGGGIALQFKHAFPGNFKAYEHACKRREVRPGRMFVVETGKTMINPRYIVNFPTLRHWRDMSRLEDIDSGLRDLQRFIRDSKIRSIAVPALGCGRGGLDWLQVRPRIEAALHGFDDLNAVIFEPRDTPFPKRQSTGTSFPT